MLLCAVLSVCLSYALHSGFDPDAAEYKTVLAFAIIASIALSVLLSRTRAGTAALYIIGTVICAGSNFLQFPVSLAAFLGFMFLTAIMYLYRAQRVSFSKAELGGTKPVKYIRQMSVICIAAIALAGALFYFVIRPLSPPTMELKLITVLKSMRTLEVIGVSSVETIMDTERKSEEPPDEIESSSNESETFEEDINSDQYPPDDGNTQSDYITIDSSDSKESAKPVSYSSIQRTWLIMLLMIPAGAVIAYILHFAKRRRWLRKISSLTPENAVINYFMFFMRTLGRAGIKRDNHATLREFVSDSRTSLEPFDEPKGSFDRLTSIFERTLYGRMPVEEAELSAFTVFYGNFYRNLRRELGTLRYCLTLFRY